MGTLVDILDSQRVPLNAMQRAERPGSVPYFGAAGQVGTVDKALFNEPLILLGEDGVQFFDPDKHKAYLIDGPSWVNNHAHVLRARSEIDRRYVCYWLNAVDYHGFANGTTRLKLTQAAMKRIPIPVPPLAEQRRIVDLLEDHLSRLEAAMDYLQASATRSLHWKWRAIAEATRGAGGDPVTLGEIATLRNGIFVSRPTVTPSGIPILRIGAIRSLSLDLSDLRYSNQSFTQLQSADSLLAAGDVLFTRYNGNPNYVGACVAVPKAVPNLTYPDKIIRARLKGGVLAEFVAAACSTGDARRQIRARVKTTAGQAGISGRDLKSLSLRLPDLASQMVTAEQVRDILTAEETLSKQIANAESRARALRRSLLAAAFSGRLTSGAELSDLDDTIDV